MAILLVVGVAIADAGFSLNMLSQQGSPTGKEAFPKKHSKKLQERTDRVPGDTHKGIQGTPENSRGGLASTRDPIKEYSGELAVPK